MKNEQGIVSWLYTFSLWLAGALLLGFANGFLWLWKNWTGMNTFKEHVAAFEQEIRQDMGELHEAKIRERLRALEDHIVTFERRHDEEIRLLQKTLDEISRFEHTCQSGIISVLGEVKEKQAVMATRLDLLYQRLEESGWVKPK